MNDGITFWQFVGLAALHLLIIFLICAACTYPYSEFFRHLF